MAKVNILIVEDEPILALSMKKKLEALGFQVISIVSSGDEAYQVILERAPDLVLMDIRLEGHINGLETAQTIWKNFHIPSVIVTGIGTNLLPSLPKEEWCYGLVAKPIREWELETAVTQALHKVFHQRYADKLEPVRSESQYNPILEWVRLSPDAPESKQMQLETNGKHKSRLLALEVFRLFSHSDEDPGSWSRHVNSKDYLTHIAFILWNRLNPNNNQMIHFRMDFEPILLEEKTAVPLGIVLSESLSNSLQFAFPHDPNQKNSIHIQFGSFKTSNRYFFKIQDNGKGFRNIVTSYPESRDNGHNPPKHGLGFPIIKAMAELLGSEFFMSGDNGTYIELNFSLGRN